MDYNKPLSIYSGALIPHPGIRLGTATDPFTNSPISQVGLSHHPLGPWRVPTNPTHPNPTLCKSRYRPTKIILDYPIPPLSQGRTPHQPNPSPAQPSINPGTVPNPLKTLLGLYQPFFQPKGDAQQPIARQPNPV